MKVNFKWQFGRTKPRNAREKGRKSRKNYLHLYWWSHPHDLYRVQPCTDDQKDSVKQKFPSYQQLSCHFSWFLKVTLPIHPLFRRYVQQSVIAPDLIGTGLVSAAFPASRMKKRSTRVYGYQLPDGAWNSPRFTTCLQVPLEEMTFPPPTQIRDRRWAGINRGCFINYLTR